MSFPLASILHALAAILRASWKNKRVECTKGACNLFVTAHKCAFIFHSHTSGSIARACKACKTNHHSREDGESDNCPYCSLTISLNNGQRQFSWLLSSTDVLFILLTNALFYNVCAWQVGVGNIYCDLSLDLNVFFYTRRKPTIAAPGDGEFSWSNVSVWRKCHHDDISHCSIYQCFCGSGFPIHQIWGTCWNKWNTLNQIKWI
jgi:hypothetical protein